MPVSEESCALCRGVSADGELGVVQVWEDSLWRVTVRGEGEVPGYGFLEPKRHVPHITDLEGEEARSLGVVLARTCRALREASRADLVYIYVFGGGLPHLHFHLVPHRRDDPMPVPVGAESPTSRGITSRPLREHALAAERLRSLLAS